MSSFLPQYRLTVYAPRSVDPTEVTPLTASSTGPHTDLFKVTTKAGVSGWQPYLAEAPRGRRGKLEPRERTTDTGSMSFRLLDKRLGTGNFDRWVTGFIGDPVGTYNLVGLKAFAEESLDDGGSWSPFYTGRITEVGLDGKTAISLQVRDMGEDLNQRIFVGTPHSSVASYANRTPLIPRGLVKPYGILSLENSLTAVVSAISGDTHNKRVTFTDDVHYGLRLLTDVYEANYAVPRAMIAVINDGGTEKWYNVSNGLADYRWHATKKNRTTLAGHASVKAITINLEVAPEDTRFAPAFPVASNVTCYLIPWDRLKISKPLPLLINDVHPVLLWRDILDGKFSPLTPSGAVRPVAYDATAFASLIADTKFPSGRWSIDGPEVIGTWIEENICKPFNLAYYLNPLGKVFPIDMRRATAAVLTSTITEADRVEGADIGWSQARDDALTRVEATFYTEFQGDLDAEEIGNTNQARLKERDELLIKLNLGLRTLDLGEKKLEIDAKGLRYMTNERMSDLTPRVDFIQRYLAGLIDDYWGPFTGGAQYFTIPCLRTANTTVAQPGTLHIVDVDPVPDPASNRRGGGRVGLCIERIEQGPSLSLGFLDLGFSANALVPSLGVLSTNTQDPRHIINVPLTLNAAGEPVQMMVVLTAQSVAVRPVANSQLWQHVDTFLTGGTTVVPKLSAGTRVWVRARSLPNGTTGNVRLQQPSDWVFPSTGYVDLDPMYTPSGVTVTNISKSTADLSWTLTDTTSEIEVLLSVGTVSTWTDNLIAAVLPPNTRTFKFRNLEGPSVLHSYAVRHRSPIAGAGPTAGGTFTTTTTAPSSPRPAGIAVGV